MHCSAAFISSFPDPLQSLQVLWASGLAAALGSYLPQWADQVAGRTTIGFGYTPFTFPFNLTGQPVITVPCGMAADGLPVGLQIVGRRYADGAVLRAAAAFEAARPWADRMPSLV